MLLTILEGFTPILITIIGALVTAYLIPAIKAHTSNVTMRGFLLRLTDAATVAVQQAMQVSVDAARADGKLTPEDAALAKAAALASLKTHVSTAEIMQILGLNQADAERVIDARIEAAVLLEKRAKSNRITPTTATP